MRDLLPFIVTGLVTGTIYGLAGSGLVLTFKTSGIFNFGHGAVLTASAMLFYFVQETLGWDWKIAFFISVFVFGPLMGIVMEAVARNLARQRTSMKIVGTVGLTVMVPSLCVLFYPGSAVGIRVERFLPFSDRQRYRWQILDVNVFGDQLVTAAIALIGVAGLYAMFRFTRIGASMRAAVDDPDLLALQGTNPVFVRRVAWSIGCTFASLSGVLILPIVGLQAFALTFLATYAFGAAAIGGFASIPITFVGGLVVGVLQDMTGFMVNRNEWNALGGLPDALPFLVLFVVLLVLPKGTLTTRSDAEARPSLQWKGPIELRLGSGVVVLGFLLLIPLVVGTKLPFYTFGLCTGILMLSLGLLVKTSGQVSLCHSVFAGIGAVAFSQFHVDVGLPWLIALALAALVTVPVGALIALPAIRLSGIYLALATFGFGILVQRLFYPQSWMYFTFAGSRKVAAPFGWSSGEARYYVILTAFVATALVIVAINQSRLGRVLRGMSDSQTAVSTLGLSTNVTKVIVFCMSAALAAVAGVMYGVALNSIDGGTLVFQPFNSLVIVAVLALAPFREPWYAVVAAITAVIPAYIGGDNGLYILNALFGLFAILISLRGGHPPMSPKLQEVLGRLGRTRVSTTPAAASATAGAATRVATSTAGLEVEHLSVRFGGLVAVDDVSLTAPLGRITGLIGPNGAGKTTTFNACSGINRSISGLVRLDGVDVTSRPAPVRARMGLGRTFQRMELCDTLTVFDNVALGHESAAAGARVLRQMVAPPAERRATLESAAAALELCGIGRLADKQAGSLSTGERRLVELARCLAGPFDLLLLDEPSSGLDREETARFGEVLRTAVAERGCGILLVEHDMALVMKVCQYIYVLDFGRMIFEGSPNEVATSEIVRSAYLGSEALELEELTEGV